MALSITKGSGLLVEHYHLDKSFVFDFSQLSWYSYFCVFWWKGIALGEFTFNAGEVLNVNQIRKKIWEVISRGISNYNPANRASKILEASFLSGDKMWFHEEMDILFDGITEPQNIERANVSVVICTRNRSEDLMRCISSILSQKVKPKEIVVIDCEPEDNSTENAISAYNNKSIIYYRETAAGLNSARNRGAEIASGEVILYTDDVIKAHPLWIYHTWKEFQDKSIAALTGLIISSSSGTETAQDFENYWSFNREYKDAVFDSSWLEGNQEYPKVLGISAGANMAFRRSVLKKINYFDEILDEATVEGIGDSEVWFRLLCYGFKIKYSPRVIVFHDHGRESVCSNSQLFNYAASNNTYTFTQLKYVRHPRYLKYLYYQSQRFYLAFTEGVLPRCLNVLKTSKNETIMF